MKKAFKTGMIVGAVLGLLVSLSMDFVMGPSLGGSWNETVANDMNRLFNTSFSTTHIAVFAGVVIVIALISGFGAVMGGICGVIVVKAFSMLTGEKK